MIEHMVEGCRCAGKRCSSCEQVKCRGAFHRSLLRLDGLQAYCRECRRAKNRESRLRDDYKEYRRAKNRESQLRDKYKEANRKKSRQWRQDHPGYGKQQRKAYYKANR